MRMLSATTTLLLAACASDPPPCDFERHQYVYETARLSGNCQGPLDLNIVPPGVCTHRDLPVTGMCARGGETICKAAEGTTIIRSVLHREDDDSTYSGLVDLTLISAQGDHCQSSYSVKLEQQ